MWEKKGLIFNVKGDFDWNKTHAQTPIADVLKDRVRIFYATRNKNNQSSISFIEVSKQNLSEILYVHNQPILDFGQLGTFDDSGLMPSSILEVNGLKYLYYIGWTTRGSVPYHNAIGLAVSNDSGVTFRRMFEGPIITTNKIEPYFSGTAFVIKEQNIFKMYYLSCVKWEKNNDSIEPFYNIKYAESINGFDWIQLGKTVVDLKENEGGIVSASVIKEENGIYKMWYGVRGSLDYREKIENSYRIGYAESIDSIEWVRKDNISGINLSKQGWDSQMISYPFVFNIGEKRYMLYNGNGFGKSGFGYAEWQ
jgi:hypothetical protein